MASAIDGFTTESDWFAQLTQMQEAIAALKLDLSTSTYGQDLDLSDDDGGDVSGASDSDNIFSYGGETDEYGSYTSDEEEADTGYNPRWLLRKCRDYCNRKFSGQTEEELADNIMEQLSSDKNDDLLQGVLADILGYEEEDLAWNSELIAHRRQVVEEARAAEPEMGGAEDVIMRLMTKEQRDAALRQADLDHKTRPLGPKLVEKSDDYPHIYRAYNAGNTINKFGKKYSLPIGSAEIEEPTYTEIKIPPTKVGTVGINEKLIAIKDMDNLCKKTFVGYKSLNRMQSLVYPVAYKTNENMLICAPTGAVRSSF